MRKQFGKKTWMLPMPVLMIGTYDEKGTPDLMNAGWGGIYDYDQVVISLDDAHKTTENIKKTGAFTVSFATEDTVIPCDYVGIVSANDLPDKFERSGLHQEPSSLVNAPIITELPMTLECRLLHFNEDGICVGEIVGVSADESVLDEKGQISVDLLRPICTDPISLQYRRIGAPVGKAFADGKKLI